MLSLAVGRSPQHPVVGGTSSGKTTLANALLAEMAHLDERVILIEDTRELQSPAPTRWRCRTRAGAVTMGDLVRSTLRLRPDRIIVGESARRRSARHAQGLEHRPSRRDRHRPRQQRSSALYRIEQLVQEASSPCRAA
jgi:type IV secretion system protein VirB11